MLNQLKLILEVSYLEFGADHISPHSFTFGWAFYRLPKPPFSCFAWVTVQVRAWAITRASCQGLHIQRNLKYCCFFLQNRTNQCDFQLVILMPTLFRGIDPAKYFLYEKFILLWMYNPVDNSSLRYQWNTICACHSNFYHTKFPCSHSHFK